MSIRLYQKVIVASCVDQDKMLDHNLARKSKFKKAFLALRVNYHLEMLDFERAKAAQFSKNYLEARHLLHKIEVDMNTAWDKFGDLDKTVDEFFKNSQCLVASMQVLENVDIIEHKEVESETVTQGNEIETHIVKFVDPLKVKK